AGIYNPEIKEKRGELNKKLRAYVYACLKQSEKLLKELTTDDTGSPYGGYTVDSELSAEIRHLITQYGVARREMLTVQLSKNSYKVNHLVTDVTVYWVDEGSAIGSTQPVLGQNELTLKKIGAIVTFTEELLEDSEIDLMSFVASRVAEGMAKKEDEAFFKGDGTSTYGSFTGLLKDSDIPAITMAGTTFASMDADDLIDLKDNVPESAQANGKFYMHRTNLSTVRKLKDSDNQYIYQRPSEKGPGTIWGDPIVTVEAMPARNASAAATAFVLYGDLKKGCIFGYKGAVKVKKFDSGVVKNVSDDGDINLITSDREAVRFTERVGYVQIFPSTNNPVTKLQTAAASA
ncbi:MAG: phage major capsid protein, partial [Patescibacteria group bacterium]|nr:phage major capsid protein [Patescibacteria group bacterium]